MLRNEESLIVHENDSERVSLKRTSHILWKNIIGRWISEKQEIDGIEQKIRLKLKETCYNGIWNSLKSKGHQILKRNKQQ